MVTGSRPQAKAKRGLALTTRRAASVSHSQSAPPVLEFAQQQADRLVALAQRQLAGTDRHQGAGAVEADQGEEEREKSPSAAGGEMIGQRETEHHRSPQAAQECKRRQRQRRHGSGGGGHQHDQDDAEPGDRAIVEGSGEEERDRRPDQRHRDPLGCRAAKLLGAGVAIAAVMRGEPAHRDQRSDRNHQPAPAAGLPQRQP